MLSLIQNLGKDINQKKKKKSGPSASPRDLVPIRHCAPGDRESVFDDQRYLQTVFGPTLFYP